MLAKLYAVNRDHLFDADVPSPPPLLILWRLKGYVFTPTADQHAVYLEAQPHLLPDEVPTGEGGNKVWNGTTWVSGVAAPPAPPEPPRRAEIPAGNYVPPAVQRDVNSLPGSPQQTLNSFIASPPRPVAEMPRVPVYPHIPVPTHPVAATPAPRAPGGPNHPGLPIPLHALPTSPAYPVPQIQKAGPPVGGERAMTAQEMALVAMSRQAPGGAIVLPPPPPFMQAQKPVDPVEAQKQAAIAAAESGKM